jgi:DNA-binding NarL/FixJ family response regulator
MKVLVADDSRVVADRIIEIVRELPNVEVVGRAHNAGETLQSLRVLKPEVLILDLEMSGDSGLDVLRAIKTDRRPIVTIVMTNSSSIPFREACRRAGAEYFLDKSDDFEELDSIVREILYHASLGEAASFPHKKTA